MFQSNQLSTQSIKQFNSALSPLINLKNAKCFNDIIQLRGQDSGICQGKNSSSRMSTEMNPFYLKQITIFNPDVQFANSGNSMKNQKLEDFKTPHNSESNPFKSRQFNNNLRSEIGNFHLEPNVALNPVKTIFYERKTRPQVKEISISERLRCNEDIFQLMIYEEDKNNNIGTSLIESSQQNEDNENIIKNNLNDDTKTKLKVNNKTTNNSTKKYKTKKRKNFSKYLRMKQNKDKKEASQVSQYDNNLYSQDSQSTNNQTPENFTCSPEGIKNFLYSTNSDKFSDINNNTTNTTNTTIKKRRKTRKSNPESFDSTFRRSDRKKTIIKEKDDDEEDNNNLGKKVFSRRGRKSKIPKNYICKICRKKFITPSALGGHTSKAHPGESYDYKGKLKIRDENEPNRLALISARETFFKNLGFNYNHLTKDQIKVLIRKNKKEYYDNLTKYKRIYNNENTC